MSKKELVMFRLSNLPENTKAIYREDEQNVYIGINKSCLANEISDIIGQIQSNTDIQLKVSAPA